MTSTTHTASDQQTPGSPGTTLRQDAVSLFIGAWLIGGVFADGWAHFNVPGLESFFTPWHAVLYGGLLANVLWLAWLGRQGLRPGRGLRRVFPQGYGLGAVGSAVFAFGGLADMGWHMIFGVEAGLDALLSPTHLVLLAGGLLILTSPLRARLGNAGSRSRAAQWVATGSTALATALAAFFLIYTSVFAEPSPVRPFHTVAEDDPAHDAIELPAVAGLAGYLVTTALLVIPVLILLRHNRLPLGGVTVLVTVTAWLSATVTDFPPGAVAGALGATAGAMVADPVVGRLAAISSTPWPLLASGTVLPLATWSGQLIGIAAGPGLGWTVELWSGVIVLSTAIGALLGWLSGTNQARPLRRPIRHAGVNASAA